MCQRSICLIVLLAVLGPATSVSADLVGHWRLDEGSGTTGYDTSGNGNDGTLIGDPQWVAGVLDGALEFDATDDYVDIGNPPDLPSGASARSICAWVTTSNLDSGWKAAVAYGSPAASQANGFARNGSLVSGFGYGNDLTVADFFEIDVWYHLCLTYDGTTAILYGNGLEIASAPKTWNLVLNQTRLGRQINEAPEFWGGKIDDVRIYRRVLTPGEIQAVMAGQAYPQALSLTPADGSMVETTALGLEWRPGELAVSHDVYFGESFDEVDQAAPGDAVFQGNQAEAAFSVADLTPGATYYWRIDEVNDTNPESPWKGDIWSFRVRSATAWNPSPADGIPFVGLDQDLTWEVGMGTLFHTVYFGESFDEVNDDVTDGFMIADAIYDPGPLEVEKTYYWRVDEYSLTGTHKGEVWSFTTVPEVTVTDPTLVGWWTFDEGVGRTAVDWSGHDHHGAISGGAQWADGYHGGALDFNGGGAVIDCGDVAAGDTGAISIACWIQPRNIAQDWAGYISKWTLDNGQRTFWLGQHATDGWLRFGIYPGGPTAETSLDSEQIILANGEWTHIVCSYDGNIQRIHADGVEIIASVDRDAALVDRGGNLRFGIVSSANWFNGFMDDVRLYDKVLSSDEIQQVMRGDPLLAGNPEPGRGAMVDIREVTALSWVAGDTAVSHDVYFGTDRDAVAGADRSAAEYRGNQPGASFSLAGLVEFGGGDYYWRIDEVEADATVRPGYVWTFTVPGYLIVDDFESYTNEVGQRVFEVWIDGIGFTQPVDTLGNGTGALVGHDVWNVDSPHFEKTIMETGNVHGDRQAMPLYYDNTFASGRSEADRTFTPAQNWTVEAVTTLVVHFRGEADNAGSLYAEINGRKVPYDGDPGDIAGAEWIAWEIDLASVGTNLAGITTLTIGIEGGETGLLYVDDIILTKP